MEHEHIIISPFIYRPTEANGIWAKTRALLFKQPDGSLTKIGEHVVSFYQHVDDETAADDYVTFFEPVDFTPKKQAIKYIFQDVVDSLHVTRCV